MGAGRSVAHRSRCRSELHRKNEHFGDG
jgi:hypothetical protein